MDGVWVGLIDGFGIVVFDPDVKNLYYQNQVSLWVLNDKRRDYFDLSQTRENLRKNVGALSLSTRKQAIRSYWMWMSNVTTKDEHLRKKREAQFEAECSRLMEELDTPNLQAEDYTRRTQELYEMSDVEAYHHLAKNG